MQYDENLTAERTSFATHLECSLTGERYPADTVHNLSAAGRPLLVRYDLDGARVALDRVALAARPADLWRYRELLPVRRAANIVSLGENATALLDARRVARDLAVSRLLIKDEGGLPTGSFKARGMSVAISMAKELGIERIAVPTAGNAGAALAAYGSRAGIETFVFCPEDALQTTIRETALQGAKVYCCNGLINDCGRVVGEGKEAMDWFDLSTLKEPYRLEGKKTMGIELAEQLGWQLPDAIFYPTGGGTGLIGMWKAFDEIEAMGWIGAKRPRMFAVQSAGCAPMVRAFEAGEEFATPWEAPKTKLHGVRVPAAVGDFLILRAVRDSGGGAIAVPDRETFATQAAFAKREGILLGPEGAATVAAAAMAAKDGLIGAGDTVVAFNCGNGLKAPMPKAGTPLDITKPVDYAAL